MDSFLEQDLDVTRKTVLSALAGFRADVFLFGSVANGTAHHTSDIDVAVLPLEPLPIGLLSSLAEALEESNILRHVDLVDLSRATPGFRDLVVREGTPWRS